MDNLNITVGIPVFNDKENLLMALGSILQQTVRPDKVVVFDSSSEDLNLELELANYTALNIQLCRDANIRGCGQARQQIINNVSSGYLTFLDSDDQFCDIFYIQNLKLVLQRKKYDIVAYSFYEQLADLSTFRHTGASTQPWCHGKVYSVEFLRNAKATFPDIATHEDVGFNGFLFNSTDNILFLDDAIYLWKYNPKSLTRKEDYTFTRFSDYIKACGFIFRELEKNNGLERAQNVAFKYTISHFAYLQKYANNEDKLTLKSNEADFLNFLRECNLLTLLKDKNYLAGFASYQDLIRFYNTELLFIAQSFNKVVKFPTTLWEYLNDKE